MQAINILWADDEIELLKPQLLFLEKRGYTVHAVTNGHDAIEYIQGSNPVDVVLLDESMPGISGLETLSRLKTIRDSLPIVLVTKNETEDVMDEALGAQIDDYLIKPVNPNQILLSIKKIIDNKRLIQEKTSSKYQQEFQDIFSEIGEVQDYNGWVDVYKRLVHWELKLDNTGSHQMIDILEMQKNQANVEFSKFIEKNYIDLLHDEDGPIFSPGLLKNHLFPVLNNDEPVVFLLLDNLRYDQWKIIEPKISELFRVEKEDFFMSILPTCTQYSRNAIFAGMMPDRIERELREYWVYENEDGGKNDHEFELLQHQIQRVLRFPVKADYHKITTVAKAKKLVDTIHNFSQYDLTCIVYNFIDMLSHARTEMEVLKELAGDEKAYRSLTLSWFEHSPLLQALKTLAENKVRIVLSTDHGTIRVNQPSKVVADRDTTTNLRYKSGKNLKYKSKDVLAITDPHKAGLPQSNVSTSYIFAKEDRFFLYPNNYNYYNNYFTDTFQHGGISMEEMICPVIQLAPKN